MNALTLSPIGMMAGMLAVLVLGITVHTAFADELLAIPAGQRQLFLDDVGIASMTDLTRTMHRPQKRGAVVRSADPSKTIQTRNAPFWDAKDELFKFWVIGTDQGYRTSPDGLHWSAGPEPDMGLSMVVLDPNDPDPSRRYKAAMGNEGFAVSPDGLHWTKLDVPAIPSSDEYNFSYDPREGLFIHTVKRGGPHGRAVAVATSRDFQNWKDYGVVFHADDRDQELGVERIKARRANPNLKQTEYDTPEHYSVQIYNMGVFLYQGIFIGMPSMYHHTGKVPTSWPGFEKLHLSPYIQDCVSKYGDYTGFYTVELVCSRDLKTWQRLGDRQSFIETSPIGAGAYDTQTMIGPSAPVEHGDELWFYYTGIRQYAFISSGAIRGYDDYYPAAGAICLAVLRRDGFVSLDAGDSAGTLLTPPFTVPAGKLLVNFRGHKHGELRVEVLDENDEAVAASEPLTGDHVDGAITWASGDLADLKGKAASLRFTLRDGSLYAYRMADEGGGEQ